MSIGGSSGDSIDITAVERNIYYVLTNANGAIRQKVFDLGMSHLEEARKHNLEPSLLLLVFSLLAIFLSSTYTAYVLSLIEEQKLRPLKEIAEKTLGVQSASLGSEQADAFNAALRDLSPAKGRVPDGMFILNQRSAIDLPSMRDI